MFAQATTREGRLATGAGGSRGRLACLDKVPVARPCSGAKFPYAGSKWRT